MSEGELKKTEAPVQPLHLTPIALAFVAGIIGALLVDAVKSRFFPPIHSTYYVQIKDFMSEKIKDYGSFKFENENDQLFLAARFSEAVEETLDEMTREYGGPMFSSPAVIVGGIDMTVELEARVDEKMRKHVEGKQRNEIPD